METRQRRHGTLEGFGLDHLNVVPGAKGGSVSRVSDKNPQGLDDPAQNTHMNLALCDVNE